MRVGGKGVTEGGSEGRERGREIKDTCLNSDNNFISPPPLPTYVPTGCPW